MASVRGCELVPAGPFCSVGAPKVGSAFRPEVILHDSLRSRAAFQRVFRTGKRRRSGGLTVIVASGGTGPPRVGVVAGAKTIGGAVRRNRAKRRLRSALAGVPLREGHDYVVIATPAVLTAPFVEIREWLKRAVGEEPPDD